MDEKAYLSPGTTSCLLSADIFSSESDPDVTSVQLIGSWDHFSNWYAMKRDPRRGRGQWKGCYSFKDIVSRDKCSGQHSTRNGGLKMGGTYYYYYELDGWTETHDPSQPFTKSCSYLPGQTVNTLYVPLEQTLRQRSASITSLRQESYMTMDPEARFFTPIPIIRPIVRRLGSASSLLHDGAKQRPQSVGSAWKRFFRKKTESQEREPPRGTTWCHHEATATSCSLLLSSSRSPSSVVATRARDISPESLRRRLVEEVSLPPVSNGSQSTTLKDSPSIAEDIEDDDDDFATFAPSEYQSFSTGLSPPPHHRMTYKDSIPRSTANSSSLILTNKPTTTQGLVAHRPERFEELKICQLLESDRSRADRHTWPCTMAATLSSAPTSPKALAHPSPSTNESNDDDLWSNTDGDDMSHCSQRSLSTRDAFKAYSLPRHPEGGKALGNTSPSMTELGAESVFPSCDAGVAVNDSNFLGGQIDTGLDDFVSELGLIVEVIGNNAG